MSILQTLYRVNRWWSNGEVPSAFLYRTVRRELQTVAALLDERRISTIVGPRRVGKSTILYQAIERLLQSGVPPTNILFFSGDDPALTSGGADLSNIIDAYASDVLHRNLEDDGAGWAEKAGKIYVFIDEVHFLDRWQLFLKSYYDRRLNVKFVVSGSSSVHLFKDSRESLMGRTDEIGVLPLDFRQFVAFSAVYSREPFNADTYLQLLPADGGPTIFGDPAGYFAEIWEKRHRIDEHAARLGGLLGDYMLAGGYPEFFEARDAISWQVRLASDIVQKALYKDIVSIYNIKNPEMMERLMYHAASGSGQEHSFTSIGSTLGVDTATASSYVDYLSQAFLLTLCDNYSPNVGKVVRKNKKIYVSDNGVWNALLRNDEIRPADAGMNAENICVQAARAAAQERNYKICFWREKGHEVDIVVDRKTDLLPVEVKFRNDFGKKDLDGLFYMMKKFAIDEGVVITKNKLAKEGGVYMIPLYCAL